MLRLQRLRSTGPRFYMGRGGRVDFDASRGDTVMADEALAAELVGAGVAYRPGPNELCPGEWIVRRRAGFGDVLCMSAVLREVVRRGGRVQPACHSLYLQVFDGLPMGGPVGERAQAVMFDGWLEHHPGRKERSAAACMGDYWNLGDEFDARPWLELTEQERDWGREVLAKWRKGGAPVVALFSRAGWPTRTYRAWAHVAKGLADAGAAVVAFDGLVLPCCARAPEGLTVRQLAAFLAAADVVVSGDSGPMHLAQAVGRPAVAVFCATGSAGSVGSCYDVVALEPEGLQCWPCWSGSCLVGEEDVPGGCVRAVEAAAAVRATLALLARDTSTDEVNDYAG